MTKKPRRFLTGKALACRAHLGNEVFSKAFRPFQKEMDLISLPEQRTVPQNGTEEGETYN